MKTHKKVGFSLTALSGLLLPAGYLASFHFPAPSLVLFVLGFAFGFLGLSLVD